MSFSLPKMGSLASISRWSFLKIIPLQLTNFITKETSFVCLTFIYCTKENQSLAYQLKEEQPAMSSSPKTHFILFHIVTILVTSNAWKSKFLSIIVFGDSTVDSGNNNFIETLFKGNHLPYGKDFPGHVPTGRYSNGKLVTDFVASLLNIKETVPPYLDPSLSDHELLTGVSFASGGSGFDDLTTVASGVIPVSKQIVYFREYVEKIKCIVGKEEAEKILGRALVIISAGTNDISFNFYDVPIRKHEFDISGYQDFLQDKLQIFMKVSFLFLPF